MESAPRDDTNKNVEQQQSNENEDNPTNMDVLINDEFLDLDNINSGVNPITHKLKVTVSISLALYANAERQFENQLLKKAPSKQELTTKPTAFFHVDFKLLPNSDVIQTDVVVYDSLARIYIDKAEVKTCKIYYLNNVAWISWNQKIPIKITDNLLLSMIGHNIEFTLWNQREKMMGRTKFDKSRTFKYDVDEIEMKKIIEKLHSHLIQLEKRDPEKVSYIFEPVDLEPGADESREMMESPDEQNEQYGYHASDTINKYITTEKKPRPKKRDSLNRKEKYLAKITFLMDHFYPDTLFIIKHLTEPPLGLIDMVVSIELSKYLLSPDQRKSLNPMTISIHSVNDMPGKDSSEGLTYEQLKEKCQPVYAKYEFLNSQPYKTCGKPHQRNIYFNDVKVILTGILNQTELKEFFRGPGLQIEIHDQDRTAVYREKSYLIFGEDINDNKFGNINYMKGQKKDILENDLVAKLREVYGICKLNLLDLLQGSKHLYRELSILHHTPQKISPKDRSTDTMETLSVLSTPKYIECNSVLKVTVKLAYPFSVKTEPLSRKATIPSSQYPFSRVIFKIHEKNSEYVKDVLLVIARLNGISLGIDNVANHVLIAILSTLILTTQQAADRQLDMITGFHFIDQAMHLIVIEGLQHRALFKITRLYQCTDIVGFTMLYSSDFSCAERLYASFNVNILKIELILPLSKILEQSLLYVRGVVPRPCFDALINLSQLLECKRLTEAVSCNILPSPDMLQSLIKLFGSPISKEDFNTEESIDSVLKLESFDKEDTVDDPKENVMVALEEPISEMKKHDGQKAVNFIKRNTELIHMLSEKNRRNTIPQKNVELTQLSPRMQNYSICFYNPIDLAKEELMKSLDSNTLYTYCPEFHHSMTFSHISTTVLKHGWSSFKKTKRWISAEQKSFLQRHEQTQKPSKSRLEELDKPYEDTICYPKREKYICGRNEFYTWNDREYDFDLWKKQPCKSSEYSSYTLPCSTVEEFYIKELKQKEIDAWKSKIIVSNTQGKFHRTLTNTELIEKGSKASSQLDRLKGLLKDKPMKLAYTMHPTFQLPALGVVNYPELDNISQNKKKCLPSYPNYYMGYKTKAFSPGPHWPERSLTTTWNQTPLYNYERQKFRKLNGKDFITITKPEPLFSKTNPTITLCHDKKQMDENKPFKPSKTLHILNEILNYEADILRT